MGNEKTLENGITVKGATLLTAEEAEKLPAETRAIGEWWWLHSPGRNSNYAATVGSGGRSVDYYDYNGSDAYAVRPALIISGLKSSRLNIGDELPTPMRQSDCPMGGVSGYRGC